jgi:hypothetical protein
MFTAVKLGHVSAAMSFTGSTRMLEISSHERIACPCPQI